MSVRRIEGALAASVTFLTLLGACASIDPSGNIEEGARSDIVILTADRATAQEVLERLQDVQRWPASRPDAQPWTRGHLTRTSDGAVYSVVIAPGEGLDEATMTTLARRAIEAWRPRYLLSVGTAAAAPYGDPLGVVGLVALICDFEIERFERVRDMGKCYRPDGGLFRAALAFSADWAGSAEARGNRSGCSPARTNKLGALGGEDLGDPRFPEVIAGISEELHDSLVMERSGVGVAPAVGELRHQSRQPIGFMMIRGVSEVPRPGEGRAHEEASERELRQKACAARDAADFAVELIRRQWPVAPGAAR
jgi:hypothetical protein